MPGQQRAPCSQAAETQPPGERRSCLDRSSHPSAVGPGVLAGPVAGSCRAAGLAGHPGKGGLTEPQPQDPQDGDGSFSPHQGCALELTSGACPDCVALGRRCHPSEPLRSHRETGPVTVPPPGWCAWRGAGIQEALAECCPLLCGGWAPCGLWQGARSSGPRRPRGAGVGLRLGSFRAWE